MKIYFLIGLVHLEFAGGLIIPRYFHMPSIFKGRSHVLFTPDANLDAKQALPHVIILFEGLTTNHGA
tara:strand:- start:52 stop:252 length:201 start_codon:yes stop_codon:yes gene_type:complete